MNTGIGDAVNLAWKLAAVLHRRANASLLESYEPERIAFARRLVATTDQAFTGATSHGAIARLVRLRLVPLLFPFLFKLATVRRLMFRTVSQTAVTYRGSSLSKGRAGKVHGGDRLPWVKTDLNGDVADNFAPLTSLDWQVHVYGDAAPELRRRVRSAKIAAAHFPMASGDGSGRAERVKQLIWCDLTATWPWRIPKAGRRPSLLIWMLASLLRRGRGQGNVWACRRWAYGELGFSSNRYRSRLFLTTLPQKSLICKPASAWRPVKPSSIFNYSLLAGRQCGVARQGALLLMENYVLLSHLRNSLNTASISSPCTPPEAVRAPTDVTPILVGPIDDGLDGLSSAIKP